MNLRQKYQNILKLSHYALSYKVVFGSTIVCGVLSHIMTLVLLLFGAYLTGLAFGGEPAEKIRDYFTILVISIILKALFAYLHMLICHKLAYLILADLRMDLYYAVERATPMSKSDYRTGNLISIIMEDVESLESFYAHMLGDYIIAAICTVLFVGIYFFLSWQMALLSLFATFLMAITPYVFNRINSERAKELRYTLGQTNAGVVDTIQGLNEIIMFGRGEMFIDQIKRDTKVLSKLEVADGKVKGLQNGLISLMMSAFLIIVIWYSHQMVIAGELMPNMIAVFIIMSLNVFIPTVTVSNTAVRIDPVEAAAKRINQLLHEKSPLRPADERLPDCEDSSILYIDDLVFYYHKDAPVIDHLSMSVRRNEHVAIIGPSGVGKTTLANLIMRFYDPVSGSIYLNGKNTRSLTPESVRQQIAYVPQDLSIFFGSIKDNLTIANPDATMEEIREAAKMALADDFIMALDSGYDAFVGERGATLSGGQKQRLGIARALLSHAEILIMDEAVSNLDTENEKLFRLALGNLKDKKTIITIAHRPSSIADADRVINLGDIAV